MRANILLSLLFLNLFSLTAQTFTEILGRPTGQTITLSVLFDTPCNAYVEYGTSKGVYSNSTLTFTSVTGQPVVFELTGLTPNTRYFYRTCYKKTAASSYLAGSEHTFITQRKPGSTFCFTLEGDPHPYDKKGYHPLWYLTIANQLKDTADFLIDMGDTFGDDHQPFTITNEEVKQLHLDCLPFFGSVCHSSPLYLCIGNHEGESGYYLLQTPPANLGVYGTVWRNLYYPNPVPNEFYSGNTETEGYGMGKPANYFAWQWGDALFIVMDAYRYYTVNAKPRGWDWTIGKAQYDWFKNTLETSGAKYKFVITHHILGETRGGAAVAKQFEWGDAANFAANRPGWGTMPIHQLMVKNKVDVFIQGHDHLFALEKVDNIIYQTAPMPSDSSYCIGVTDNGDAFTDLIMKGSGHLRFTVSPDSIRVEFVSAVLPKDETAVLKNDQVVYAYSVKYSNTTAIPKVGKSVNATLSILPNPARDQFSLQTGMLEKQIETVRILSLDGKTLNLFKPEQQTGKNTFVINTTNWSGKPLSDGLYGVLVTFDDHTSMLKNLLVKH